LLKSCERLSIPLGIALLESQLADLVSRLFLRELTGAAVKITVTRGLGGRGYGFALGAEPTIVIAIFPAPVYLSEYYSAGVAVRVCQQRLSVNASLAGLKHLNRLEQILARAEWQDEAIAEGVLLDARGNVIEAVFSNIFMVQQGVLLTPDLSKAGVAGVMRRFILEVIAPRENIKTRVRSLKLSDFMSANEIFLCNSLYGIWPVRKLIAVQEYEFGVGCVTRNLQELVNSVLIRG
jgi:4-amino-4-deoxychorismate lyase